MSYLLDGALRGLPVLAQLLRRHRRQRRQAGVLHRGAPVRRARRATASRCAQPPRRAVPARARLLGRQHQGRSRSARGASGDQVLFVGDHIYGDMLRVAQVVELAHGDGPAGAGARGHDLRPAAHPLARLDRLDAQLIHLDSEINERQTAMRSLQKLDARRAGGRSPAGGQAHGQGGDREAAHASCARPPDSTGPRGRDRLRLQPVLGPAVPRGLRGQQVRRAGRGLRLRLHEPRVELPLLLAHAVLPRPARPHAARTG